MKLSLNFPDRRERIPRCHVVEDDGQGGRDQQQPTLKARIPITVLSQPLSASVTATTAAPSDLSFSLSTNFRSGPSLKLSFTSNATPSLASSPFSVTLKSGLGLFGSPKDSPLTFSAHFPLSPSLRYSTPIFSLQFKPRIGHFSLHSSSFSNPQSSQAPIFKPLEASDSALISGFPRTVPHFNPADVHPRSDPVATIGPDFKTADALMSWEELRLEPCSVNCKSSLNPNPAGNLDLIENCKNRGDVFSGVSFAARTAFPITKNLRMNFRWGVNLPGKSVGFTMPYLTIRKICLERDDEVKILEAERSEICGGDSELLKGLCMWMKRDLEVMRRENEDMKEYLEEMRSGVGKRLD
ncbi:hypothetical protein SAY86_000335 [Trapa natans]|uniref:Uncharacterized protein n=1 Tax=Trapa natans TaxID=22666 RepID=A0AAN7MN55_TRANT|nr:hypothetical protein SAY86_000335 [Trapa natans]